MQTIERLCINCKYYDDGWIGDNYVGEERCLRPIQSPVTGIKAIGIDPERERSSGECGSSAIFFEQHQPSKHKKFFFF